MCVNERINDKTEKKQITSSRNHMTRSTRQARARDKVGNDFRGEKKTEKNCINSTPCHDIGASNVRIPYSWWTRVVGRWWCRIVGTSRQYRPNDDESCSPSLSHVYIPPCTNVVENSTCVELYYRTRIPNYAIGNARLTLS